MARADTASASLRSDSIQGLAKSIAKPAYRRLLSAEPLLRRAVPVLIIAFLITICIGAVCRCSSSAGKSCATRGRPSRRWPTNSPSRSIIPARDGSDIPRSLHSAGACSAGMGRDARQRSILVADADGTIVASLPNDPQMLGRPILDLLGPSQPLTTFGAAAGTLRDHSARRRRRLGDGAGVAKSRSARSPWSRRRSDALTNWRSTTALTVTLSATTGFVVLILGFAFHWQATRAREADLIHDTVRGRIDTALNRGRCGLWDWDLARGRVFWSRSMFDILGLPARDDLLTFGELNALVHQGDIDLYGLARATRRRRNAIDRSRFPHAPRQRPLAVAAGALRIDPAGRRSRPPPHRHRRRRIRTEKPGRENDRGRSAAARRHRDHPRSLRVVGRRQPPGALQFEFPGTASAARRGGYRRRAL